MTLCTLSSRKYGVEIEAFGAPAGEVALSLIQAGILCSVESYHHETRSHWKLTSDSSLVDNASNRCDFRSFDSSSTVWELVSPPLSGDDGLRQIKTVCEVLNRLGVTVNNSCGLHVHHEVGDFDLPTWKALLRRYANYEELLDEFQPQGRRRSVNGCCVSLVECCDISMLFKEIGRAQNVDELANVIGSRYHKVNMQSFWRHGTVEFRHHAGTVDFTEIANWIILTQSFVEHARAHTGFRASAVTLQNLCCSVPAGMRREVLSFYKNRQAQMLATA